MPKSVQNVEPRSHAARRAYTLIVYIVLASIDNTVLALLPTLTPRIRDSLGVSNQAIGLVISLNLVVVALTALVWGYRSDQSDRRRLLISGTLAWALPIALVPLVNSFGLFLGLMVLAGIGLGCISTVGYSIITDLVPSHWRGLLLAVWGLAQGIGALAAGIIVGVQGQQSAWQSAFGVMAIVGVVCSVLALGALAPRKGQAETGAASARASSEDTYRIQWRDLPVVLGKRSNRWLMAQGFLAQFTYGSLTWLTALLTARLLAQQVPLTLANGVAALLWVIVQLGGIVSLFWGWLGDRLYQRSQRARALLAAFGFWAAVPCYLLLFWAPLPISAPLQGSALGIVGNELARNGWWWLAILGATLATIAQATNAPNWFAMVADVNLPEQRGTAFSFVTLANNLGRALGTLLVGGAFDWLQQAVSTPLNYALGLSLFQVFFLPAGLCFWLAARSAPADAALVRATIQRRAAHDRAGDVAQEQQPIHAL